MFHDWLKKLHSKSNNAPSKQLYSIDRPDESREYLQAWSMTGKHLQSLFNRYNHLLENPYIGFCWMRSEIISPTFDSMNFRYKNRAFSILIDFVSSFWWLTSIIFSLLLLIEICLFFIIFWRSFSVKAIIIIISWISLL